jgi:hypothetical protein
VIPCIAKLAEKLGSGKMLLNSKLNGQAMLTKEQARELVVAEIERPPKYNYASTPRDLVVVDEHTIERAWGWVFFYNSARYLETRE